MNTVILCVINDLNTDQRMQRICTTLQQNGYFITLIGRKKKSSLALNQQPYKQRRFNCFFEKGKLFYIEYHIRLFFFLLMNKAEILVANDLDTFLPCYLVSKIRECFLYYDAHELFTETPEVERRPTIKKLWLFVEKMAFKSCDLIYTVSDAIAKHFEEKYQRKVSVIRNMPLNHPIEKDISVERILLYQGAINEGRGLENLFLAMQQIDAILWLAGDGDLKNNLQKLSLQLGLGQKIIFLGVLLPAQLYKTTLKSKVGINLLENRSLSYKYSLANKFFDYVMAEIPQLCINFEEYKNINNQHEVAVLSSLEVTDIVNNINLLLNNHEVYNRLKSNCKLAKLSWNWQKEEQKLLTLYHKKCLKPLT